MPNGEEFLFIPMDAGYYRYSELMDGSLNLADIAVMNEFLMVKSENEGRAHKAFEADAAARARRT